MLPTAARLEPGGALCVVWVERLGILRALPCVWQCRSVLRRLPSPPRRRSINSPTRRCLWGGRPLFRPPNLRAGSLVSNSCASFAAKPNFGLARRRFQFFCVFFRLNFCVLWWCRCLLSGGIPKGYCPRGSSREGHLAHHSCTSIVVTIFVTVESWLKSKRKCRHFCTRCVCACVCVCVRV